MLTKRFPGATRKEFPDHGRQLRDKWSGRGDQGPVHQLEAAHLLDRGQPGHRDLHCACSRLLTGAYQDGKTFQTYKNLFSNSPRPFKLLEVVTTSQPPAWLSRSDLNVQIQLPRSEKMLDCQLHRRGFSQSGSSRKPPQLPPPHCFKTFLIVTDTVF